MRSSPALRSPAASKADPPTSQRLIDMVQAGTNVDSEPVAAMRRVKWLMHAAAPPATSTCSRPASTWTWTAPPTPSTRSTPSACPYPWGNAFTARRTRLTSESEAARVDDGAVGRTWHVSSTERTNRLGRPTAYALYAQETPTLMAAPESSIGSRAAFATKHVWVTQFADDERYAAGTHVNQHAGGAGLPAFQAGGGSLTDLALAGAVAVGASVVVAARMRPSPGVRGGKLARAEILAGAGSVALMALAAL